MLIDNVGLSHKAQRSMIGYGAYIDQSVKLADFPFRVQTPSDMCTTVLDAQKYTHQLNHLHPSPNKSRAAEENGPVIGFSGPSKYCSYMLSVRISANWCSADFVR